MARLTATIGLHRVHCILVIHYGQERAYQNAGKMEVKPSKASATGTAVAETGQAGRRAFAAAIARGTVSADLEAFA